LDSEFIRLSKEKINHPLPQAVADSSSLPISAAFCYSREQ